MHFLPHEDFAAQDLSIIIRHELTHYKRKDLWYKILLVTARVIHWFNPFAYMMCRHANADIEQSCDDYLLAGNKVLDEFPLKEKNLNCLRFLLLCLVEERRKRDLNPRAA